jgi:hypothetical protein
MGVNASLVGIGFCSYKEDCINYLTANILNHRSILDYQEKPINLEDF